jgi:hypothetical protein
MKSSMSAFNLGNSELKTDDLLDNILETSGKTSSADAPGDFYGSDLCHGCDDGDD